MMSDTSLAIGMWQVSYAPESGVLGICHEQSGMAGHVSLEAWVEGERCHLGIGPAGFGGRISLLDVTGSACGYVSFHGDGDRLYLRCVQLAGQWLSGELSLRGLLSFPHGFTCRVHCDHAPRVVHLGSGLADSDANDGIYDPVNDRCLWLGGASSMRLTTVQEDCFSLDALVRMEHSGSNELVFTLERQFYGVRYVPYYKVLDRHRLPAAPAVWLSPSSSSAISLESCAEDRRVQSSLLPYGLETMAFSHFPQAFGDLGMDVSEPAGAGLKTGHWLSSVGDKEAGGEGASSSPLEAGVLGGSDLIMFSEADAESLSSRLGILRSGDGWDGILWCLGGRYTGPVARQADISGVSLSVSASCSSWSSLLYQGKLTLSQLFIHGIAFWLHTGWLELSGGLSLEECRVAMVMVALPGLAWGVSGAAASLPSERVALLRQALPSCPVHPLDLFPLFELVPVWDLKVCRSFGTWDVVALFNWGDEEDEIVFTFEELGLSRSVRRIGYEFFTDCCVGCHDRLFGMVLPPHSVRVVAFHDAVSRPQFLSSDRHVSQGGTDLESLSWCDSTCELRACVALVPGHETVLTFHVPGGYALRGVETALGCKHDIVANGHGILRVAVLSEDGQRQVVRLMFTRN